MVWKIDDLYKKAKANNTPMLIHMTYSPAYPTLYGDFDRSFIDEYKAHFAKYDRAFWLKYKSKEALPCDDCEDVTTAFIEFQNDTESLFDLYLEDWARLYYAMRENYNPLYNVDGITETHTQGKVEGLGGEDTTTDSIGATHTETSLGNTKVTSKDYHVPSDSQIEKHVDSNVLEGDHVLNEADTDEHEDEHKTEYGRTNNVDYTVTEERKGNIGVTKSTELIRDEVSLRVNNSFFDIIFAIISNTVSVW